MFALAGTQPQIIQSILPVSHVASVLTSNIHTLSNAGIAEPTYSRKSDRTKSKRKHLEPNSAEVHLKDLGLSHLDREIDLRVICPILNPTGTAQHKTRHSHWKSNNSSAHTYFENKYGFSESELHRENARPRITVDLSSMQTRWLPKSILCQQTRGFKTRRKVGSESPDLSDPKLREKLLRESIFGSSKTSPSKKDPKFKALLSDAEKTPEVQDKLKIAFAEGYSANSGEGKKPPRKFLILMAIVAPLLLFYIIKDSLNKEFKFNMVNGEKFAVDPEDIHVTFEDVKGADEAKQELMDVVEFLRDPEKFRALGAKLPKGVLLVGMPGIGKTLLARAVAGEAEVPFFHASGSEFDEVFVGTGARRVRSLFGAAKMRAPCVVFLDEIDTVGAKRSSSQLHPYANQTINQLLSEMDGFHQSEGIIVLGATNKRENLDIALLRPGRFDVEVKVYPPDLKGRREILQLYLNRIKMGSDIDIDRLAKGTTGCTGADLENVVNQAAIKAGIDGCDEVTMEHLEFARDKVLMGPAKKTRIPDEDQNLTTAYHEAGHTLVAYYTKDSTPINKVTIIPRGQALGFTSFIPEKDLYGQTKSQLLAKLDVAMGGRVAEELIFGSEKVTTGASSDFSSATDIAAAMVRFYGMSEKVGVRTIEDNNPSVSQTTKDLVDAEIKRLLQESYDRTKNVLRTHISELKSLAQALMEHETLDLDEVKIVVNGKSLEKKVIIKPDRGLANS